ncbi:hypothetical protein Q765_07585 [Flavobacterium rivuli WB 3.3-2 = DSM 21788]|uniref:Lipoprotein n=1 Tax=Flavobacterium rivuli WB 3.3-2 = DSM 21788 TaxID=1121895 RepID=A0A0A2MFI9_9FLAO|nr:hypothetical protein [Flavobacterium rivuli]KGO87065.1 hypothetical protein Q765_07585 [Flavobacterium rivuli WB 3.3-2 = DSM 21788]
MKRNKTYYSIIVLIFFLTSCDKNVDEFITLKSNINRTLKIHNHGDSMILTFSSKKNNKIILTEKLVKDKDGYKRKIDYDDDLCGDMTRENIILALKDEFRHSYECVDGRHDFYIIKLNDGNFLSIENVYGIYSYSNRYYYNREYKILKFEQYLNTKKYEYLNVDNLFYKIDIPKSLFVAKIKRDSINYQKKYFKISD